MSTLGLLVYNARKDESKRRRSNGSGKNIFNTRNKIKLTWGNTVLNGWKIFYYLLLWTLQINVIVRPHSHIKIQTIYLGFHSSHNVWTLRSLCFTIHLALNAPRWRTENNIRHNPSLYFETLRWNLETTEKLWRTSYRTASCFLAGMLQHILKLLSLFSTAFKIQWL